MIWVGDLPHAIAPQSKMIDRSVVVVTTSQDHNPGFLDGVNEAMGVIDAARPESTQAAPQFFGLSNACFWMAQQLSY